MSEHKFKAGDMVRTKPMKIIILEDIDQPTITLEQPYGHHYEIFRSDLEPLAPIQPDSDAVETVALAIAQSFRDRVSAMAEKPWSEVGVQEPNAGVWTAYAQAAIIALEAHRGK